MNEPISIRTLISYTDSQLQKYFLKYLSTEIMYLSTQFKYKLGKVL